MNLLHTETCDVDPTQCFVLKVFVRASLESRYYLTSPELHFFLWKPVKTSKSHLIIFIFLAFFFLFLFHFILFYFICSFIFCAVWFIVCLSFHKTYTLTCYLHILKVRPENSFWSHSKCNHGHNILIIFDTLPIFFSPQVKRSMIISNKNGIYESQLRLRIVRD